MQHLSSTLEGVLRFRRLAARFQTQVRFLVYRRIKPHDPLLVRVPVYSFEFQPCGRTTQAAYLTRLLFSTALRGSILPIPGTHSLGRGLLGYLILFATHAFVLECQACSSKLPLPLVFLPISALITTTPAVPLASPNLEIGGLDSRPEVKPQDLTTDLLNHLRTLYAQ